MSISIESESTVFTLPNPRKFSVKSSIQHWQLRDLIRVTGRPNELAVVNQNSLTGAFKELSFSPASIASGCNYLTVGGQRSQVSIFNLETQWNTQVSVGGSINNALCITKATQSENMNEANLYVCNNDESIKVIELPTMKKVGELKMPFAVNNVQISPDGRWLVAVGDSSQVLVYTIRDTPNSPGSGIKYEKMAMVRGSESAFSCSWNHLSNVFAVGFQDGTVKVWDTRFILRDDQRECMAAIHASQKGKRSNEACRSVKFCTDSSTDLLAFSEHLSVVNLVDCRNWMDRQSIRLCPPHTDLSITGLTFGTGSESNCLYVGLENCVVEYEINLMKRKSFPCASFN